MSNLIGNTVSALFASQLRVSNAANNIANADSRNFTPQDVVQSSDAGSVQAQLVKRDPASVTILNSQGELDTVPNVDLGQETVTAQLATYDFKANATVLKAERDLQKKLFDIFA